MTGSRGRMITRSEGVIVVALVVALAACNSTAGESESSPTIGSTVAPPASTTTVAAASTTTLAPPSATTSTISAAPFPVVTFAAISEDPVSEELAARFQTALDDFAEGWGMTATVMTAEGTWSGTAGKADGIRDLRVDDQFSIASITKSVVAAQVMLMVEAGELDLDDFAADHLPRDLEFDTNGTTIRHLLSHRSGLPDYYDLLNESQETDFQRVWTPSEILELLPTGRTPPGGAFGYAETNYLLLGLVIEHLRGRPLADVLRDGALAINGLERLVHQPDESPTEPMAMPGGESTTVLELRGGYLPSLAAVTAFTGSGAFASDSPSLARWWRAFCAGEIVSQASLTEMAAFDPDDGYGLGLYNPAQDYAWAVGHTGELFGYMSWAACLPEDETVIVVLTNRLLDDGQFAFSHGMARPLLEVLRSD